MDNDLSVRYYLDYELGIHHQIISVSKKDFFCVIDDISSEFEIIKEECGVFFNMCEYSIINYWGDKQVIGAIVRPK